MGIEPTLSAWEAEVLPLNYTRVSEREYIISPVGVIPRCAWEDASKILHDAIYATTLVMPRDDNLLVYNA